MGRGHCGTRKQTRCGPQQTMTMREMSRPVGIIQAITKESGALLLRRSVPGSDEFFRLGVAARIHPRGLGLKDEIRQLARAQFVSPGGDAEAALQDAKNRVALALLHRCQWK